jgi:hypothetical protein
MRVHRIVVARGACLQCRKAVGGSGTIMIIRPSPTKTTSPLGAWMLYRTLAGAFQLVCLSRRTSLLFVISGDNVASSARVVATTAREGQLATLAAVFGRASDLSRLDYMRHK